MNAASVVRKLASEVASAAVPDPRTVKGSFRSRFRMNQRASLDEETTPAAVTILQRRMFSGAVIVGGAAPTRTVRAPVEPLTYSQFVAASVKVAVSPEMSLDVPPTTTVEEASIVATRP